MQKFETRNVLDRIETTFTTLFNEEWKRNFSPFLVILVINIVGGGLLALLIPILALSTGSFATTAIEKGFVFGAILFVFVLAMVTFYWIMGNLSAITTFLIFQKTEQKQSFDTKRILLEAKRYIPAALRFDGYYYSIVAIILFVCFLAIFPGFMESIDEILGKNYSSPILMRTLFSLFGIGFLYIIFSIWFSTRYLPAKPGFILEQKHTLKDFSEGKNLTIGNFWNILGNLILVSIIIGLVVNLWDSMVGGLFSTSGTSLPWEDIKNDGFDIETMTTYAPQILSTLGIGSWGGSMIVGLISGIVGNIFRYGFSYVLYKNLSIAEEIGEKNE